jgi:hypothetical protein
MIFKFVAVFLIGVSFYKGILADAKEQDIKKEDKAILRALNFLKVGAPEISAEMLDRVYNDRKSENAKQTNLTIQGDFENRLEESIQIIKGHENKEDLVDLSDSRLQFVQDIWVKHHVYILNILKQEKKIVRFAPLSILWEILKRPHAQDKICQPPIDREEETLRRWVLDCDSRSNFKMLNEASFDDAFEVISQNSLFPSWVLEKWPLPEERVTVFLFAFLLRDLFAQEKDPQIKEDIKKCITEDHSTGWNFKSKECTPFFNNADLLDSKTKRK